MRLNLHISNCMHILLRVPLLIYLTFIFQWKRQYNGVVTWIGSGLGLSDLKSQLYHLLGMYDLKEVI